MNDYETLKVAKAGHVVTATLHRPTARNTINIQMVRELGDLMENLEDAQDVSVLVIRGGSQIFSGGIDLRDFSLEKPPDIYGIQKWETMCRQLERLDKFTIAAVQGDCIGGGVQLALVCDARIAERRTVFRLNEVKLGFLPGMATFRLAKFIGMGRAKNLMLTGRPFAAEEALAWGILDQVCEPAEFEANLRETIDGLMPFHPVALQMGRRLLDESFAANYEDFLGSFLAAQHRAINSEAFNKLIVKAKTPQSYMGNSEA